MEYHLVRPIGNRRRATTRRVRLWSLSIASIEYPTCRRFGAPFRRLWRIFSRSSSRFVGLMISQKVNVLELRDYMAVIQSNGCDPTQKETCHDEDRWLFFSFSFPSFWPLFQSEKLIRSKPAVGPANGRPSQVRPRSKRDRKRWKGC